MLDRNVSKWFRAIGAIAFALSFSGPAPAAQAAGGGPGPEVCKNCHADQYDSYMASSMSVKSDARTPGAQGGCVVCHTANGDGSAHVKAGGGKGVGGIINPGSKTLATEEKNKMCLTCHQKGRVSWQGSKHQTNDVACTNCHSMHKDKGKDKVRDKMTQTEVCYTCHKDKRAEMNRASTHPVRSGGVACSSCHNPHGTAGSSLLIKNTINETCYTCHAEKRGPFLWEHPPASDNCANCHNPHGSNTAPLLKARAPYLCLSCHLTGTGHPNQIRSGVGITAAGANAQTAVRACLNCHIQVHGSNHPSGPRWVR